MISKKEYVAYLLSTPFNYTCSNMAAHKVNLSHDVVRDFLPRERFTPSDLWQIVKTHIDDSPSCVIIADDSVQDKRYSHFIELVKKQYSGNQHGLIKGIGLVNFVHSSGNDGDFWPIDYRIYHPQTDGKTKNDYFQEMFMRLITHKHLKTGTILFDTWYASVANLKLVNRHGWTFLDLIRCKSSATTLKSNRKVSVSKEMGYQHLHEFIVEDPVKGLLVKLKEIPFLVKLFKIVAPNGDIDYVITNDIDQAVNLFVAQLKNDDRWQVEDFHRGFKQLTGSEKCQCRKARWQRNHLACCYHAWVSLKVSAKRAQKTIYQVIRKELFSDYLIHQLICPTIKAV